MKSAISADAVKWQTFLRKGLDEGGSHVPMLSSSAGESKVTRGPVQMCRRQSLNLRQIRSGILLNRRPQMALEELVRRLR